MRRREDQPITKHSLNLFAGDFARLQHLHGRLGAGKVIRVLVRGHIQRAEERAAQALPDLSMTEIGDLDLEAQ